MSCLCYKSLGGGFQVGLYKRCGRCWETAAAGSCVCGSHSEAVPLLGALCGLQVLAGLCLWQTHTFNPCSPSGCSPLLGLCWSPRPVTGPGSGASLPRGAERAGLCCWGRQGGGNPSSWRLEENMVTWPHHLSNRAHTAHRAGACPRSPAH